MSIQHFPSRQAIESAEPVAFTEAPRPVKLVVHAEQSGWPIDVELSLPLDKVPAALARLASAGLQPRQAAQAVQKPKRTTVEPIYQPDGTPCCPVHKKPLREGQWGLHCTAKADGPDSKNGYCGLRFAE